MRNLPIKILAGLLLFAFASHAVPPTDAKSAIDQASAAEQYLCLIFYETQDASLTGLSSSITAFKKTSTKKITIYKAKMSNPANKEIADKYGVPAADLPLLLIFAPNGAITGGFPKAITADQLKQSTTVSELMLNIIKQFQEQKVVLVALQNSSTKFNTESWAGVNEFANDPQYKQLVAAIKADPAASGNQEFIKQCQLLVPMSEATVVVLLPPGKIAKVLNGKVTKDDIFKSLQSASCSPGSGGKGGCCSDRRFKQNIVPIASALDKVTKLQGVSFTWNRAAFPARNFSAGKEIGLIAQDVESVIPEVVLTDVEGYKSITYDKLTAVLIEAVKELKTQMNSQYSIIKGQSARIKALEAKK